MVWLEKCHAQKAMAFRDTGDGAPAAVKIIAGAFAIVRELREVEWEVVEKVLEQFQGGNEVRRVGWR